MPVGFKTCMGSADPWFELFRKIRERGIDVSHETIRRWSLRFGIAFAKRLRDSRPAPSGRWRLDEVSCASKAGSTICGARSTMKARF